MLPQYLTDNFPQKSSISADFAEKKQKIERKNKKNKKSC